MARWGSESLPGDEIFVNHIKPIHLPQGGNPAVGANFGRRRTYGDELWGLWTDGVLKRGAGKEALPTP